MAIHEEISWYNTKKAVLEGGAHIVIARDKYANEGAKEFAKIQNYDDLITYYSSIPPERKYFYEWMLDNKPVKLFFDIDIPLRLAPLQKEALQNQIIEKTIEKLTFFYDVDNVNYDDFAIIDSSGYVRKNNQDNYKTSFHVVLTRKICFTNPKTLKLFINKAFVEDNECNNSLHIDFGVYGPKCLRMPLSTKRGQERYLTIKTEHTLKECLVTCIETSGEFIFLNKITKNTKKTSQNSIHSTNITSNQVTDNEFFIRCIDILPSSLAEDYEKWIDIGIKLFLAGASEHHWHIFSRKSNKYNYNETKKKWYSFTNCKGSTYSFFILVSKYDPELVEEIKSKSISNIGMYDNEISRTLWHLYNDEHVFSCGDWYYYNGLRWIVDTNRTYISRKIMVDFHQRLDTAIMSHFNNNNDNETEKLGKDEFDQRLRIFNHVKLRTQSGRMGNDWHALNVVFDQPDFKESLDTKKHLIGFENGVYDLNTYEFRLSNKDDMITMSVRYKFDETFDDDTPEVRETMSLLMSLFPDETVLEYTLCFLSSAISGHVKEELIHFWTGLSNSQTGANGKSTVVSLMLNSLGDYATGGHSSIITSQREYAYSSNPALMALKNKRFVTFQEIENERTINMSVVKGMTGNDLVTGRQLYQQQETFVPHWHIVVCANALPPVSSDDGGTRRRIRNIPFDSKYVENPQDPKWKNMKNIYKIDYELKERIKNYKMAMMYILIKYHIKYNNNGLPLCERILLHTDQYFKETNPIDNFIKDFIVKDEEGVLSLNSVINALKIRKDEYNIKTKNTKLLEKDIQHPERLGEANYTVFDHDNKEQRGWKGYKLNI